MNTNATISRGVLIRESRRALARALGEAAVRPPQPRWFTKYERVGPWVAPWNRSRRGAWLSIVAAVGCLALLGGLASSMRGAHSSGPIATVSDEYARYLTERQREIRTYAMRYGITPDLAALIIDISRSVGVDTDIAFRLIEVESGFNPYARSPMGALGLTQLMPATARWLYPGIDLNRHIFDPEINVRLGLEYLKLLIDQYNGDLRLALLAYNRGPGTVNRLLVQGIDPENGYALAILE